MQPKTQRITKVEAQQLTRHKLPRFLATKGFVHNQILAHNHDPHVRQELMKDLGERAGKGNLPAFKLIVKFAFESKDVLDHGRAVRLLENLAKKRDKRAFDALGDVALNHENKSFRTNALIALRRLAKLGHKEVVDILNQVRIKETDPHNRGLAGGGLRDYKQATSTQRKRFN